MLASARRRLACGCASCRNQTKRARRFATEPSIWRLAWWGRRLARRFVHSALFRDRFIGVVRMGHPLSQGEITPARYASGRHISVSRRGLDTGPIDEALKPFGLERAIVTIVGSFSTALALARASDLIASVPERQTGNLRAGMHSFPLPVPTPEITISLLWHPRLDADERIAGCAVSFWRPARRSAEGACLTTGRHTAYHSRCHSDDDIPCLCPASTYRCASTICSSG